MDGMLENYSKVAPWLTRSMINSHLLATCSDTATTTTSPATMIATESLSVPDDESIPLPLSPRGGFTPTETVQTNESINESQALLGATKRSPPKQRWPPKKGPHMLQSNART